VFQNIFRTSDPLMDNVTCKACRNAGPDLSIGNANREESPMIETTAQSAVSSRKAVKAVAAGGLIAGAIDLTQACILFGWDIPLSIAAGLLGRQALHGGVAVYLLGVSLHFFIATSFAAFYYAASRKLTFLTEHPIVCGLAYGAGVELVMRLVVLPLSALHARGPYHLGDMIQGLLVHMVVVGLPISFSVRRFAR
jgi:hypothetical protein